jgi:methylglutaconyl-CoA hydratase
MLSMKSSLNFALKSAQMRKGCISLISSNKYCMQADKNEEIRLSYLTDDRQGIAVIEMNRVEGKNSFNRAMASNLHKVVDILGTDKNVRAVIIRSLVKGVFCAGADLKERKTLTPIEVHRFVNSLRQLVVKMENLPMPTIAAIDGLLLIFFRILLYCDRNCATY